MKIMQDYCAQYQQVLSSIVPGSKYGGYFQLQWPHADGDVLPGGREAPQGQHGEGEDQQAAGGREWEDREYCYQTLRGGEKHLCAEISRGGGESCLQVNILITICIRNWPLFSNFFLDLGFQLNLKY